MSTGESRIAIGSFKRALLIYRIFAIVTGTVLLAGTIGLIAQKDVGPLWLAHGYLFMAYAIVAVNLGIHLRWKPIRIAFLVAAGTIPTLSFVAERIVVQKASARPNQNLVVNRSDS